MWGVEIDRSVCQRQNLGVHISNQFPGSAVAAALRTVLLSIDLHTDPVFLTQKQRKKGKQPAMVAHAFNSTLEAEAGGTLSSMPAWSIK